MIYYISGKDVSDVEINECKFKRKLYIQGKMIEKGSHYIQGIMIEKDKRKLKVNSCQFESDDKYLIDFEFISDFLQNDTDKYLSKNLINFDERCFLFCHFLCFCFNFFIDFQENVFE